MYALVDCNNFYVSCEKVFAPWLEGKPVVVLSNNDGCIISRSQEAKDLGLRMAEPAFKRQTFLTKHGVEVFSSNYALYGDMSDRVMNLLSRFAPDIEIYSIDECFLDLNFPIPNLYTYIKEIKDTVVKSTGIPVGIGVAKTKALAKLANRIAKKYKKLNGICNIETDEQHQWVLRNTPIEDVWGIGRQHLKLMRQSTIGTAADFVKINDHWIKKKMTVAGLRLKKELLGEPCLKFEEPLLEKRAIATTRAFGHKLYEKAFIEEAVATYASRCSEKLRKQKSGAKLITVFIHSDPFSTKDSFFKRSKTVALPVETNSQIELVKFALIALSQIFQEGILYKKAGVIVSELVPETERQANLFQPNDGQQQKIMEVLDQFNKKYGRDKIKLAAQGSGEEWKLRQEKLSKHYTTQMKDIMIIKAK